MTGIYFYHLKTSSLEKSLPRLLEKVIEQRLRVVVLAPSKERVEALNHALWIYTPLSFLPHGSEKDGNPSKHPIWLTTKEECPNNASVLILTEGMDAASLSSYPRCLYLFDGNETPALEKARASWLLYQNQGHSLTYWKQTLKGNWEKSTLFI